MKRNSPPVEDCGCCDCPPCNAPTFLCTYSAASAYNCGFPEYGTPSSPARFYGTRRESATFSKTRTGTIKSGSIGEICCSTQDISGSGSTSGYIDTTVARLVPTPPVFGCDTTSTDVPPDWDYNETSVYTFSVGPDCSDPSGYCAGLGYSDSFTTTYSWNGGVSGYTETIISPTEFHLDKVTSNPVDTGPTPVGFCGCLGSEHTTDDYEEHRVFTLSGEITESDIRDDAIELMGPLGELTSACSLAGAIIASLSYSEDRKTCFVKSGKYGFRHPVPAAVPFRCGGSPGGGSAPCYRITWDRIFTPVDGDPVTTPMTYTWDGVTPDDYDVDDPTTWPKVEHTEDVPSEEGAVTLDNVEFHCTGCA